VNFLRSLILSILFAFLSPLAIAQDDAGIRALLAEAETSIGRNDLPGALAKTQEALRISADNVPALLKQINIYFLMNNEKEALRFAGQAIEKHPSEPDFYYMRAIINNSKERYSRALEDFNRGFDLKPAANLYKYYLGRGISYFNLLEYDRALSDLSSAIEMNDTLAGAYHSRALVNYEMHDYAEAVEDFLKALNYSKGNSVLFFNLGMSYYRLNEKSKACPYFHKACTLGNNSACRMALMECTREIPSIP